MFIMLNQKYQLPKLGMTSNVLLKRTNEFFYLKMESNAKNKKNLTLNLSQLLFLIS